jgi:hypothetical protein
LHFSAHLQDLSVHISELGFLCCVARSSTR